MSGHAAALSKLVVGDIFHAAASNGASLICLVEAITETVIRARTVTTQWRLTFDRRTGTTRFGAKETGIVELGDELFSGAIDSTTPLPLDIHNIMLGLDRKFRLEREPERIKLNADEKRALQFVHTHYPENQL